jgi:D-glycero-alpha-D-manno-heptose 1-phosphate guanylyltransferase
MNGDCFSPVDFRRFYETHLARKILLSMVLTKVPDVSDYGKVELDGSGKIINFNEKKSSHQKSALINAGIYLMRKDIFDFMPPKDSFSLEYDFFPKILGFCYGFVSEGKFIDIGTPERYKKTVELFSK